MALPIRLNNNIVTSNGSAYGYHSIVEYELVTAWGYFQTREKAISLKIFMST